jgi:ankyrin repeat protein
MNVTNSPVVCSHAKVIAYLILQGAPVDTPDIVGRTALHHLASNNRVAKVLNALFMGNPNPNSRERYGTVPLHSAVMNSQAEVVELCLAKGGDLYAEEADRVTPADMLRLASPAVNAIVAKHIRGMKGTTALMEGKETCVVCGKTGSVKQCTRCRIARYCGQECQRTSLLFPLGSFAHFVSRNPLEERSQA